jgi:uncharacterized membrane protein (UPF0127 family)
MNRRHRGYPRRVALARSLPGALAPRFARAPRVRGRTAGASFELVVAAGFALRLRGLAGLGPRDLVPLLFRRCRSVHTFGMRSTLDVVWLEVEDENACRVLAVERGAGPRRLIRAPQGAPRRRTAALELPAGEAIALGLEPGAALELTAFVQ